MLDGTRQKFKALKTEMDETKTDKILIAEQRAVAQLYQKLMKEDKISYEELMERMETDPHYSLVRKMQILAVDSVLMPTKGKKVKADFMANLSPEELEIYQNEVGGSAEIIGNQIKSKLKRKGKA